MYLLFRSRLFDSLVYILDLMAPWIGWFFLFYVVFLIVFVFPYNSFV